MKRTYIAIDLKSFYASVECRTRGYDPLVTNLVVADKSRTDKTICLAVSPALKSFGIPGRPRLGEVKRAVHAFNNQRKQRILGKQIKYYSIYQPEIQHNPAMGLDFIVAPPRMNLYEDVSAQIYGIYLQFIAPEDIHVYSIDEAFMDVTGYLQLYHCSAQELAERMINSVFKATGITATVGIGPNLYLAKIAMDMIAKHITPTENGMKVATLTVDQYRKTLWEHQPLTDFWQIGHGYARRLDQLGLHTMGEIAACSVGRLDQRFNPTLLYRTFGIKAELLIDHAWGEEPLTITDIKNYHPQKHSVSIGQVLPRPYSYVEGLTIIREMSAELALRLVKQHQGARQLSLTIRYDRKNLIDLPQRRVHQQCALQRPTNLTSVIQQQLLQLYHEIVEPAGLIRKITVCASQVTDDYTEQFIALQTSLFEQPQTLSPKHEQEQHLQATSLAIQQRFGKDALFTAQDLAPYARTRERNHQIGGHHE